MSGKIFVHIGLPKTATTSLQKDFFPFLTGEGTKYIGVFHPRGISDYSNLYDELLLAIKGEIQSNNIRIRLKESVRENNLILSEEMILVSQPGSTWKQKLANLKIILDGFDYEIIITVREPVSGLFSYYCECYHDLGKHRDSFLRCALQLEQFQIFHYKKLIFELSLNFERKRLNYFEFEKIIVVGATDLFNLISPKTSLVPKLLINNNSRFKIKNYVVTLYNYCLQDAIRDYLLLCSGFKRKFSINFYSSLFTIFNSYKYKKMLVRKPSKHEMIYLREVLHDDLQAMKLELSRNIGG